MADFSKHAGSQSYSGAFSHESKPFLDIYYVKYLIIYYRFCSYFSINSARQKTT